MPDTNKENKVQFNLKNVHYAVKNDATYGTPVPVPGAVNLNLSSEGDSTPFYADGMVYYQSVANNGYSGDLEIALVPIQMLKDIWGFAEDANKVIVEDANVEPTAFALLFQIDGDSTNSLYVMYSVTAQRPAIASATNEASKTPQTQSLSMTAIPNENGKVMARTTAETLASIKENWFKSVYVETTPEGSST